MLDGIWIEDVRYGVRVLLAKPRFTLFAVLMLAMGIGANTAVFSVLSATVARPLPYYEPDRLVWLTNNNRPLGISQTFLNPADILDYREQMSSFEQVASWGTVPLNISGLGSSERLDTIYVTTNFFQTLGVRPMLGRDFVPEDAAETSESVILSHSLWQRQFGGDPDAIGRKFKLGDRRGSAEVIGVMPPELDFPPHIELYSAYSYDRSDVERGGTHNDRTIARLRRGVTVEQAQAEIDALARHQAELYPKTNKGWEVAITTLHAYIYGSAGVALPLLMGAVGLVLLMTCTNVSSLQMARAISRRKEMAVRLALGAGRRRIVGQMLTESLTLAIAGGALGLLIAFGTVYLLRTLWPGTVPGLKDAAIDARALGFTAVISLLAAVAFGLLPALQSSKSDLTVALKDSAGVGRDTGSRRLRNALVVAQIAIALVLLVSAGLLVRSFEKLNSISPGFRAENILSAGVSLSFSDYPGGSEKRVQFFRQALDRISALPGVEEAGAISHLPLGGRTLQAVFKIEGGRQVTSRHEAPLADYRVVTPSLFATLGIPLRKGRLFTEQDTDEAPKVIIINEAFARTYMPGQDPINRRVYPFLSSEKSGEIIGVVGDVKHRGLEGEAIPTIYVSYLQDCTFPIMNYVVRTEAEPSLLAASVRREVESVDSNQAVFNVRPLSDFITDSTAARRFNMVMTSAFALIALLLAGTGIYGVMAFTVAQRSREMGVRLALGAQRKDLLRLVLGWGVRVALAGSLVGLAAALSVTRLMSSLLYGVSATDPTTFLTLPLLMMAVALGACYFPARRAMKTDPLVALRYE